MPESTPDKDQHNTIESPYRISWRRLLKIITPIFVLFLIIAFWFVGVYTPSKVVAPATIPIPETQESTPSAKPTTESAQKDETADWVTFQNEKMGISMKYPSDLEITDPSEKFGQVQIRLLFTASSKGKPGIVITSEKDGVNLKVTYDAASKMEVNKKVAQSIGVFETRLPDMIVDQIKAIVVQIDAGESEETLTKIIEVHIKKGNDYYLFSSNAINEEGLNSSFKTLKLILETVKFLPS